MKIRVKTQEMEAEAEFPAQLRDRMTGYHNQSDELLRIVTAFIEKVSKESQAIANARPRELTAPDSQQPPVKVETGY